MIKARDENSIQKKTETEIKMPARMIVTRFSFLNCKVIPEAKVQAVAIDRQTRSIIDGHSSLNHGILRPKKAPELRR